MLNLIRTRTDIRIKPDISKGSESGFQKVCDTK